MSKKPGVMIYFNMLPAMRNLSNSDKGILFEAILDYGNNRKLNTLTPRTQILWPLVQQRLDYDEMQYMKAVTKRAYSAYIRWAQYNGETPMDFTTWQEKKGYTMLLDEAYEANTGSFVPGA